jgi:hypothetical protein
MTTFGTLKTPFEITDAEALAPIPQGGLIEPYVMADTELITGTEASRFPVPPSAFGFLIDEFAEDFPYDGVDGILTSALTVEATHLEPTTGQIWPR